MVYDSDPNLKSMITRFDQNGIELKTKNQDNQNKPVDGDTGSNVVSQMAKRATANAQAA
jgi:hypothetical protein